MQPDKKIPNIWQEFLRFYENKSDFFHYYHKNQLLLCVQKVKRLCPHLIKQYLLPHAFKTSVLSHHVTRKSYPFATPYESQLCGKERQDLYNVTLSDGQTSHQLSKMCEVTYSMFIPISIWLGMACVSLFCQDEASLV